MEDNYYRGEERASLGIFFHQLLSIGRLVGYEQRKNPFENCNEAETREWNKRFACSFAYPIELDFHQTQARHVL